MTIPFVGVQDPGNTAQVALFPDVTDRTELDARVSAQLKYGIHEDLPLRARTDQRYVDILLFPAWPSALLARTKPAPAAADELMKFLRSI